MSILIILKLVGALALLIYGMKVMSEALQKMAGSQLRHILGAMTTNRITGMLTGTFITTAVQSSTAIDNFLHSLFYFHCIFSPKRST